jgi:hypothetical protein
VKRLAVVNEANSAQTSQLWTILRTVALGLYISSFVVLNLIIVNNFRYDVRLLQLAISLGIVMGICLAAKAFLKATDLRVTETERISDQKIQLQANSLIMWMGVIVSVTVGPVMWVRAGATFVEAGVMAGLWLITFLPLALWSEILKRKDKRHQRNQPGR